MSESLERKCVELGARMRLAQKKYFKTRRPTDLQEAKQLEAEFDKLCDQVLNADKPQQGDLFGGGQGAYE